MKRLLNVLYVMTEDSYLSKQGEAICVHVGGAEKVRVPAHTLESIICFGNTTVSTPLIGFLGERGVGLSFLAATGRFLGRFQGPVSGNVLLRKAQYAASEVKLRTSQLAYWFVVCKIANCRNVLLRAARDHADQKSEERLRAACTELAKCLECMSPTAAVETIRGMEGQAANVYFGVFDEMVKVNKSEFAFTTRSRRPPLDNINAILSFLYVLLVNDVRSALEAVGLDPAVGFLHALRPGRPGLALDLMEELRPWLCDRLAVSMVNLRQLQPKDFESSGTGIRISDEARRRVIEAWQRRKREEVQHPFLDEKVPIGLVPHLQAQLLARHMRGDLEVYPPFHWK